MKVTKWLNLLSLVVVMALNAYFLKPDLATAVLWFVFGLGFGAQLRRLKN